MKKASYIEMATSQNQVPESLRRLSTSVLKPWLCQGLSLLWFSTKTNKNKSGLSFMPMWNENNLCKWEISCVVAFLHDNKLYFLQSSISYQAQWKDRGPWRN